MAGGRVNDLEAEGTEVSREFVIGLWISFWTVDDAAAKDHFTQVDYRY